jgi:hypothetical protein
MNRLAHTLGTITLLCSLAACSTPPPTELDRNFGQAVRNARVAQTLNPSATGRAHPPPTSGAIAKASMDRYQKSFETPPPPVNVLNIGVGTSSGNSPSR